MIKFASTLLMILRKEVLINTAMSFQHILHFFRFKIHLRASEMAHSVKSFIHMPDDPRTHFGRREPSAESCLLLHTPMPSCVQACVHTQ